MEKIGFLVDPLGLFQNEKFSSSDWIIICSSNGHTGVVMCGLADKDAPEDEKGMIPLRYALAIVGKVQEVAWVRPSENIPLSEDGAYWSSVSQIVKKRLIVCADNEHVDRVVYPKLSTSPGKIATSFRIAKTIPLNEQQ